MHACMHAHACMHIHTYIYIYRRTFSLPLQMALQELRVATRDWSKSRQLGSGSYGAVFKGEMEAACRERNMPPVQSYRRKSGSFSTIRGTRYGSQIVGRSLKGHPQKGPPSS